MTVAVKGLSSNLSEGPHNMYEYKCNLKAILRQGNSHPKFHGDVIFKHKKI